MITVKLLTDGTRNNPLLGFCLAVISRHSKNWPPTEQVLAKEFVSWLGVKPFLTRDAMRELCLSKGINLSFTSLAQELRGFNCSFQDRRKLSFLITRAFLLLICTRFCTNSGKCLNTALWK